MAGVSGGFGVRKALLVSSAGKSSGFADLSCTKNDVEAVRKLLEASDEYVSIIILDNPDAEELKAELRSMCGLDNQLSEFFFYYSGHGYTVDSELFYVTRNFKMTEPAFSGLSDSELLKFVRDIGPELFVHVSDSCYSGKRLLKSSRATETKEIRGLIRFASSAEDKTSTSGDELSLFTDHFIEACVKKEPGEVFYTDINAALSDSFRGNSAQEPYTIFQSQIRALFCSDSARLNGIRSKYTLEHTNLEEVNMTDNSEEVVALTSLAPVSSLEERLALLAKQCKAVSSMEQCLEDLKECIVDISLSDELTAYKLEVEIDQSYSFHGVDEIDAVVNSLLSGPRVDNFVEPIKVDITNSETNPMERAMGYNGLFSTPKPREYSYELRNNCNFKDLCLKICVFSKFDFIGAFKAEMIIIPSLLKCDAFLRLSYARPNGNSRSFEGISFGKWSRRTMEWDRVSLEASEWLRLKLNDLVNRRTSEVLESLELGSKRMDRDG